MIRVRKPKAPPGRDMVFCVIENGVPVQYARLLGEVYRLTSLSPNPVANPSWQLETVNRKKPAVHHCSTQFRQNVCDCPDYLFRRGPLGEACKHIAFLVAFKLLPDFGG